MPPVQFNSYAGGPHGLGPVVLPERKSVLGDIGSMLNEVGKVPGNMQQANLKYQLNNLLLQALTQPQTKSETIPGREIQADPGGVGDVGPEAGGTFGSIFTEPTTRQVPNPEYAATTSRLEKIGPAFGMKFPTPLENIIAAQYAKSQGAVPLEQERQRGRTALEAQRQGGRIDVEEIRGERDINKIDRTYGAGETKSTLQAKRLEDGQKLKDKDVAARKAHDEAITNIASKKETGENERLGAILKEREKYHNGQIESRAEFNRILRSTAESSADLRQAEADNKLVDNLVNMRSQINLLTQQPQSTSQQTQLNGAIEQYNALVDQANSNPNAPKIDYWKLGEEGGIKNWLRSFVPFTDEPHQEIVPTPRPGGGTAPTRQPRQGATPPTSKPLEATPPGTPGVSGTIEKKTETTSKTYRPGEIPEDELKRRRDEIFGRSKGSK